MNSALVALAFIGLLAGGVLGLRRVALRAEAKTRQIVTVTYPRGAKPDQVLAFTRSLTGLLAPRLRRIAIGSPAVVVETVADAAGISHRLRLPAGSAEYVLAQLRVALPGVRIEETADVPPVAFTRAVELRTSNADRALRSDQPAESAAALLATLAPLQESERVVIQWVVSPTSPVSVPDVVTVRDGWRDWLGFTALREPVRLPAELVRSERDKRAEPSLFSVVRIGVQARSGRDRVLLRRVLGAFHLATSPWARFRVRALASAVVASRIRRAAVPLLGWAGVVNAAELAAFVGIPVGEPRIAGLTLGASPQLPPASEIPHEGRVLGRATFPGAERPVAISPAGSLKHLHVIGPTGSGKSTLLANLIVADASAGHGVVLLDPQGDLVAAVLDRLDAGRDVIVFDPLDAAPVGFNLLSGSGDAAELVADQVVSLFRGLFAAYWGPRSDDCLRAALLTLMRQPGMTLAEVPQLLTDEGFRHRITADLDDPVLEGFWGWFEALSVGERAQVLAPLANKLRSFLLRKRLRNVIGQSQSTFSLADVIAERKVLLCNLATGRLGEDAARLLGSALLAQLWQAVQARAALPADARHPVYGYVDEFQQYLGVPTSFADMLARARGFGFGLTLAHQGMAAQLPGDLKQAVLTNVRSRVAFQVGHTDAVTLAREFGPDVSPDDLGALGPFEAVAAVAVGPRVSPPVTITTPPPAPTIGHADTIRARSRARYGRDATEVERALRRRAEGLPPKAAIKRTRRAS
jgi:hypothetical protein